MAWRVTPSPLSTPSSQAVLALPRFNLMNRISSSTHSALLGECTHHVAQVEHNLDLLGTLGNLLAPGGKLSIAEVSCLIGRLLFYHFFPSKADLFVFSFISTPPPQAGGAPICAYDIPHKTFSQKNSQESIPSDMDHLWSITLVMTCLDMPSALGLV